MPPWIGVSPSKPPWCTNAFSPKTRAHRKQLRSEPAAFRDFRKEAEASACISDTEMYAYSAQVKDMDLKQLKELLSDTMVDEAEEEQIV